MKSVWLALASLVTVVAALTAYATAQQQPQAAVRLIAAAADALGGRERILAVKTIVLDGYGEAAYQNGGGNISASPDAPQKWVRIPEYQKTIDLEHRRMRVRQRNHQGFVFASAAGYLGAANPNFAVNMPAAVGTGSGGAGKTLNFSTNFTAKIGEWGVVRDQNYKFHGQIDEVSILTRALSADDCLVSEATTPTRWSVSSNETTSGAVRRPSA